MFTREKFGDHVPVNWKEICEFLDWVAEENKEEYTEDQIWDLFWFRQIDDSPEVGPEEHEITDMHWYLVDDLTSKRGELYTEILSDNKEEAIKCAVHTWNSLSEHDKRERDAYEINYGHAAYDPENPGSFNENDLDFESETEVIDIRELAKKGE